MGGINSTVTLHNGVKMPWLGLGVYDAQEGDEVKTAIKEALKIGYRSIDTAAFYHNEVGVGEAVRESAIPREDIFVTTKVWNTDQGYEETLKAFDMSMEKLGLDYLDLYLVHWPVKEKYKDTYRALEELYAKGRVRAIGVSNFSIRQLKDLLGDCHVKPMINQIELHPMLTQEEVRNFCKEQGIHVQAWSPLMRGKSIFTNETIQQLASKYNKTPAQIILRWDIQSGILTIPKSVTPSRIKENSEIFDFELSQEDMKAIDNLNQNYRTGQDPEDFKF